MMLIQIIEKAINDAFFQIELIFTEGGKSQQFNIQLLNPHDPKTEEDLEWYYEQYIDEPFIASTRVQRTVKNNIVEYGIKLFKQLFHQEAALTLFYDAVNRFHFDNMRIEIIGQDQSLGFQSIIWEMLRDPQYPNKPLVAKGVKIYRRGKAKSLIIAKANPSSELNLLIVTARPSEENDVNYRTIQRPLIEALSKSRNTFVNIHILRPGTFEALKKHLDDCKAGFYHIIHFDLHGEVMSYAEMLTQKRKKKLNFSFRQNFGHTPQSFQARWGRYELEKFEGNKAFLFFETQEKGVADPASAEDIATLLQEKQIPVCILNACQSAKQEGESSETSLGKYLNDYGVNLVLAMRYSVSVTGATILMKYLYEQVFKSQPIDDAIALGRTRLFDEKNRQASLGYDIELEDWALPIIYKNNDVDFKLIPHTNEQKRQSLLKQQQQPFYTPPIFGFFGRDLDILKIEKMLSTHSSLNTSPNFLLLRGMVGVGKSELLKYLAYWWTKTGFRSLENIIYIDFEAQPLKFSSFLKRIATDIFDDKTYKQWSSLKDIKLQAVDLANVLKSRSISLMIDNIFELTDSDFLTFFQRIREGESFVLFGSVNPEEALSVKTFGKNVYELSGLDENAAYQLAAVIIERETEQKIKNLMEKHEFDFKSIMQLMAGFPSVMAYLLPFLKTMDVPDLLAAFQNGTLPIK